MLHPSQITNQKINFVTFATILDKIKAIHDGVVEIHNTSCELDPDPRFDGVCFSDFDPVSEEEGTKILNGCAPKSCCLDPVPTKLVKEGFDILIPLITRIINQSFT